MVCFEIDNWLIDYDKTMWIAHLSNGSTVYQDDNRPGLEPNAWFRLKEYVYQNNLDVVGLDVRFRCHTENSVPIGDYDGVFFKKGIMTFVFQPRSHSKYLLGSVKDGIVSVKHWRIPEIILEETDERKLEKEYKECVILNTRLRSMEDLLVPNSI